MCNLKHAFMQETTELELFDFTVDGHMDHSKWLPKVF